jgi:hypothetical protein
MAYNFRTIETMYRIAGKQLRPAKLKRLDAKSRKLSKKFANIQCGF